MSRPTIAALALCLASTPALAGQQFVETFDGGAVNEGLWRYFGSDTWPMSGGNPGRYLRTALDTFAPMARTTASTSAFVGDWRAAGVTSMGFDLMIEYVDFSPAERPATLMLLHNNNTRGNPLDDTAAYFMGPDVPLPGDSWQSYDYAIDSASTTLPSGWALLNMGDSGAPPLHSWNDVIQHVSTVQIFYGNPEFFFIFQNWITGLDNVRITTTPARTEDLDGSGDVGFGDLLILLGAWGPCPACPADLDGDGTVGFSDLLQLLAAWS